MLLRNPIQQVVSVPIWHAVLEYSEIAVEIISLGQVVNSSLTFTPSVEYSKYVEHSNIKEYETDKKM